MENPDSAAFFTIASRNYVSHFRVWRESVRKHHPDCTVFLVLVDEPFDDSYEFGDTHVLLARDMFDREFDDMALRYDVLELNTAVKAKSFQHIFDRYGFGQVVYFDPDTVLYASVDPILKPLREGAAGVVTPHVLEPLLDDFLPNDADLLRSGTFNLGFLGLSACEETFRFLNWWAKRLRFQCLSAISEGLFTDQKWCDLLPSFMPSLAIVRHAGANVAYWNIHQRPISSGQNGELVAGAEPLLFLHYSGFSVEDPKVVSRHQDRLTWDDLGPAAKELFLNYKQRLLAQGWEDTRDLPYAYAKLNGFPLSLPIRRLYARLYPDGLAPDAISALDVKTICISREALTPQLRGLGMSSLAAQLFSMRPDLQARFAIRTPWGRWRFQRWLKRHAAREYQIPSQLLAK